MQPHSSDMQELRFSMEGSLGSCCLSNSGWQQQSPKVGAALCGEGAGGAAAREKYSDCCMTVPAAGKCAETVLQFS